jgi:hypothetical protein
VLLAGFVSTHRCGAAPEWVRKAPSPDSRLNPSLHLHEEMDTFGPNNLVRTGLLVKENFYDAARMHKGESTP